MDLFVVHFFWIHCGIVVNVGNLRWWNATMPLPMANYCVRDLGVTYDNKLRFDDYIHKIVSKAFQMVNLIYRTFVSKNTDLLCRAFKTYVRPILEYCSPIWSPYLLHDINKIESVQRYFTCRLFPGQQLIYTERLSLTNLNSLESRRIKFDLLMYCKIINNLVDTDSSKFVTFVHHSFNTRGHGLKLTKKLYPTNALANTFANRCINCWNALPSSIVSSPTLAHFEMQLEKLTYPTIEVVPFLSVSNDSSFEALLYACNCNFV